MNQSLIGYVLPLWGAQRGDNLSAPCGHVLPPGKGASPEKAAAGSC